MIPLILLLLLTHPTASHQITKVEADKIEVQARAGQPVSIELPFDRSFKAEPQLQVNKAYVQFRPTRLELTLLKGSHLRIQSRLSVLQSLRSSHSSKFSSLTTLNGLVLLHSAPTTLILAKETDSGFTIIKSHDIDEIRQGQGIFALSIGQEALILVKGLKKAFLVGIGEEYISLKMPDGVNFFKVKATDRNGEFIGIDQSRGISLFIIDRKSLSIILVRTYFNENNGFRPDSLDYVDICSRFFNTRGLLYVLSRIQGIIKISFKDSLVPDVTNIFQKSGCEAMEATQLVSFIVICSHSTYVSVMEVRADKFGSYKGVETTYWENYFTNIVSAGNYYFAEANGQIFAFWDTEANSLPVDLETKTDLQLRNIETYSFVQKEKSLELYVVESGWLQKYEVKEQKPELIVRSSTPAKRQFRLFIYGSCSQLPAHYYLKVRESCRVESWVNMNIQASQYSPTDDYKLGAFIVTALAFTFMAIIWVCFKKYKGLENEARRVLESYKKKKVARIRAI